MVYGAISPLSSPWPVSLVPPWLCELVGEGFLGKALSLRCGLRLLALYLKGVESIYILSQVKK